MSTEKTASEIRALATVAGTTAVGGVTGLYLQVRPPAASWILRLTIEGKRRSIGLGSYPSVSLSEARSRARDARSQVYAGINPLDVRAAQRDAVRAAQRSAMTFHEATQARYAVKRLEVASVTAARWLRVLELYALPELGALPVSHVDRDRVLSVLAPLWTTKTPTARLLRAAIEEVLAYAIANGARSGDNPARWAGNLERSLASPERVHTVEHHRALELDAMPAFMRSLRALQTVSARCLEFAILTAARSSEARGARWSEIDLEAGRWTIPANRMKAKRVHTVPLSSAAIELLESLERDGSGLVFASGRTGSELSAASLSYTLREQLGARVTLHGFRSTFKEWARCTDYRDELSELALAHSSGNATRAAYARSSLLSQRAELLQSWSDWLAPAPVIQLLAAV